MKHIVEMVKGVVQKKRSEDTVINFQKQRWLLPRYCDFVCGIVFLCFLAMVSILVNEANASENHSDAKVKILENYGNLPLSFEANQGQTDSQVKFMSHGNGYTLFLTPTEVVLALNRVRNSEIKMRNKKSVISKTKNPELYAQNPKSAYHNSQATMFRMGLVGANPQPKVAGLEELPGKVNYFTGKDSKQWHTNIPTYKKVKYQSVYPGVDLLYYGNQRQLEYDFVVVPGANPRAIALAFQSEGKLKMDNKGDLVLRAHGGEVVRWHKPAVYQEVNGLRKPIAAKYALKGKREIGFQVANYDRKQTLVIDPVLVYSTYLGGSSSSSSGYGEFFSGGAGAADKHGNVYVTGSTSSTDFPIKNALLTTLPSPPPSPPFCAFVTKIDASGSELMCAMCGNLLANVLLDFFKQHKKFGSSV